MGFVIEQAWKMCKPLLLLGHVLHELNAHSRSPELPLERPSASIFASWWTILAPLDQGSTLYILGVSSDRSWIWRPTHLGVYSLGSTCLDDFGRNPIVGLGAWEVTVWESAVPSDRFCISLPKHLR